VPAEPRLSVKLVVLAVSCVLILFLAEAAVRIVRPQPLHSQALLRQWIIRGMYVADAHAGYRLAPHFQGRLQRGHVVTHFATNSLGLRDKEPDDSRRPRVLVFGDSNTWGWGVKPGNAWPAVVETALQDRHPHVQVLNCGTNGYGTANELGLFEEIGPALRPDLVVLGFYTNDYADNLLGIHAYTVKDGWLFDEKSHEYWQQHPLLRSSQLLRLISSVEEGIRVKRFGGIPRGRLGRDFDEEDLARGGDVSASLIVRMRDAAAHLGARLAVVWLPSPEYATAPGLVGIPVREELQARVEAAGIPSIDLLAPVRARPRPASLYIPGDRHFNTKGHRIIGRRVARFILAKGLLPADNAASRPVISLSGGR